MNAKSSIALCFGALAVYVLWPTFARLSFELNPLAALLYKNSVKYSEQDVMLRRRRGAGRYTTGLLNPANDCYANSVLQALAASTILYEFLVRQKTLAEQMHFDVGPLSSALRDFMFELNRPIESARNLSPWVFLSVLEQVLKCKILRRQHDAHELLHVILETLASENEIFNDSLVNALKPSTTDICTLKQPCPFSGELVNELRCLKCGYVSRQRTAFLIHTLIVPQHSFNISEFLMSQKTIPDIIKDYACVNCRLKFALRSPGANEELQSYTEDPWSLPARLLGELPKIHSVIHKTAYFGNLPQILVLHLSRSVMLQSGVARNSHNVSFPEHLLVRGYPSKTPFGIEKRYRLVAQIRHSGSHYSGHYECARRKNLTFWSGSLDGSSDKFNDRTHEQAKRYKASLDMIPQLQEGESNDQLNMVSTPKSKQNNVLPFPNAPRPLTELSSPLASPELIHERRPLTIKPRQGSEWWSISDTKVKEATTSAVLSQTSAAYILFYEMI